MGQPLPKPALRPYLASDTPMLAAIFVAAVQELTGDDYSEEQQEAWAAAAEDEPEYVFHEVSPLLGPGRLPCCRERSSLLYRTPGATPQADFAPPPPS